MMRMVNLKGNNLGGHAVGKPNSTQHQQLKLGDELVR